MNKLVIVATIFLLLILFVHILKCDRDVYLDNAATTQESKEVKRSLAKFSKTYGSMHRGSGKFSVETTKAFGSAIKGIKAFISAPESDGVLITKNASDSLNRLCKLLKITKSSTVINSVMDHNSNDLCWRAAKHKMIEIKPNGTLDITHAMKLLNSGNIDIVTLPHVSNVTGVINPIGHIFKRAKEIGAITILDCSQSFVHAPIDKQAMYADYVVASSHKAYSPIAFCGILVGPLDGFKIPDRVGGGEVKIATADEIVWSDDPEQRLTCGSENSAGAVGLHAAIVGIQKSGGLHRVAKHEGLLMKRLRSRLERIPTVQMVDVGGPVIGIQSFTVHGIDHTLIATKLAKHKISVRTGCFCAGRYVERLLGINKTDSKKLVQIAKDGGNLPGLVRVSFGDNNTLSDVDRFCSALESILPDYLPKTVKPKQKTLQCPLTSL